MDKKCEDMWNYLINNGIGCKVKTQYGIGKVIDVDAGAAILVEPLNEDEDWEQGKFDVVELEPAIKSN